MLIKTGQQVFRHASITLNIRDLWGLDQNLALTQMNGLLIFEVTFDVSLPLFLLPHLNRLHASILHPMKVVLVLELSPGLLAFSVCFLSGFSFSLLPFVLLSRSSTLPDLFVFAGSEPLFSLVLLLNSL